MASAIIAAAGFTAAAAAAFAGGWWLRGLRDSYRYEVARDRKRDEGHA